MQRYIFRRILQMIPIALGISIFMFTILTLAPGDPVDLLISSDPRVKPEDVARLKRIYGLDQPIHIRYVKWLGRTVQGDLGWSRTYKERVTNLLMERIGNSLWLTITAFFLALLVAVPVGIYSALKQYSFWDYLATTFTFFGVSIPVFWFAIMTIYIFAVWHPWTYITLGGQHPFVWLVLPPGGISTPGVGTGLPFLLDRLKYMIAPAVVLALLSMATYTRYTRSSMLEVIRQDYVRTARAKGLKENKVINKHALRNALIPLVTIVALSISGLFAGAPVTETVFAWPGVGRLLVDSVLGGDYVVAQAVLMFLAVLVLIFNLVADIGYAMLDPRIRYD
ncbi:MAG TPA: ABC transporter permease [bacterium]